MIQHKKDNAVDLELYQVLLRHKAAMFWTFTSIMVTIALATFLGPKTYTSEAKLFVRLGRESVNLDPTVTAGNENVVMVQESREYEINSVFELLKSREVLSNVIKQLGPEFVLGNGVKSQRVNTAGLLLGLALAEGNATKTPDDDALKRLARDLTVAPAKKSNIINIAFQAHTPELAQEVVSQVIEQARDAHARVNRTDGSLEFFAEQAEQSREKLLQIEDQLRDLKNTAGITSLGDQRALKLKQIADLQKSLLESDAGLRATKAESQAHEQLLKVIPEKSTLHEMTGMPNSAQAMMRHQLFTAQVREKELLAMYTQNHPMARVVRDQIDELQAVLKDEPREQQVALGPNATHQEINLRYLKNEPLAASLQAQAAVLREQLKPLQQELAEFNNQETEIARLEREIELAKSTYKKYSEGLEQARIDGELASQDISNLNVLQRPTYSIVPTKPRKSLNLLLGFAGALATSLGLGLFLEQRRSGWVSKQIFSAHSVEANGAYEQHIARHTEHSGPEKQNGQI